MFIKFYLSYLGIASSDIAYENLEIRPSYGLQEFSGPGQLVGRGPDIFEAIGYF